MINKPGSISLQRCVDHNVIVNLEHVAANAFAFIIFLSFIAESSSNNFTSVLNHLLDHHTCYYQLFINIPKY